MPRSIPTYQRQFMATDVQSAPRAQSSVSATSPEAQGLASLAEGLDKVQTVFAEKQKKSAENQAAVDVANTLSKGEVYWQEDFTKRAQAWSPGAPDMREGIGQDFDKWMNEQSEKLPTDASKKFFQQHAIKMRTTLQTNAFSHQEKTTADKMNADTVVATQADENTVFAAPERYQEVFARRVETILARTDLSDGEKIRQSDVYKRKLSVAVERGQMERDPAGWYQARFGSLAPVGVAPADGTAGSSAPSAAIAQAIYGQESGGGKADTSRVNAQNVTGPMQMQEGTFNGMKRLGLIPPDADWKNPQTNKEAGFKWVDYLSQKYNGDPAKVAAAYYGGEKAVAADGTIKRDMKNLTRPDDPTVGQYVDQVVGRMKKQDGTTPINGDKFSMTTSPDAPKTFTSMDWDQQSALRSIAEGKIRQSESKQIASVVGDSANVAVAAQNIGNDLTVDIAKAKKDALASATKQLGRALDETQQQHVEAAVERAASVRERDRRRGQENSTQMIFDALDKNGGDYQAVRKDMAGDLDKLPREMDQRIQKYAGLVATGETRPTDWVAYSQLVDNPKTLLETNLPALRDKFGASEYAQLVTMQDKAKKAADAGMPDQTILGDMAVVKGLLKDAGISSKSKEAQFFSVLQREMDARRAMTGKKELKQEDVKAIATDLLTKEITHKGVLWDTKDRAFQITVPAPERAKIQEALTSAGLPVNETTILRAYRNKLNQKPAAPAPMVRDTSAYNGDWYGGAPSVPTFQ